MIVRFKRIHNLVQLVLRLHAKHDQNRAYHVKPFLRCRQVIRRHVAVVNAKKRLRPTRSFLWLFRATIIKVLGHTGFQIGLENRSSPPRCPATAAEGSDARFRDDCRLYTAFDARLSIR